MSKLDEVVVSYRIFENSTEYLGVAQVTLPDIEFLTTTISGAGIAGEVEEVIKGHIKAMRTTINFNTYGDNALALTTPVDHTIDLREVQQARNMTAGKVELRKVSDDTLIGSAPDITKHFIELRGIGIVDVKALFGASSVKDTQSIDLVIRLEDWDKDKDYDRLGLEENYTEYLGNKVVCHNIPIRPGRNLAIICESAAVNHRQKKMGYNAAQELYARVQQSLAKRRDEDDEDFFEGGD